MSHKLIHVLMLLPILAAAWRSFGAEIPTPLAPDRVISWTALTALQAETTVEVTDASDVQDERIDG